MKLLRLTFKTDIRVELSERSSATGARGRKSNANPMGGSTIVFIGRRPTASIQCHADGFDIKVGFRRVRHHQSEPILNIFPLRFLCRSNRFESGE